MERNSVPIGTETLPTPNKNATIGASRKRTIISFIDTCKSVYAGSPFVNSLHTNTIAVQGAAPKRTAPAIYSLASSGPKNGLNTTKKKKAEIANIVNGLINQLMVVVKINPLGFLVALTILLKSIFNIIGKIINQIKIAVGIDTL